jgi:DNA gyrase subunit A
LRVTDKVGQLAALRLTTDPEEEVLIITASGMVLRTMVEDIRQISRQTQGVIVMRLQPDDQVVAIAPVGLDDEE